MKKFKPLSWLPPEPKRGAAPLHDKFTEQLCAGSIIVASLVLLSSAISHWVLESTEPTTEEPVAADGTFLIKKDSSDELYSISDSNVLEFTGNDGKVLLRITENGDLEIPGSVKKIE